MTQCGKQCLYAFIGMFFTTVSFAQSGELDSALNSGNSSEQAQAIANILKQSQPNTPAPDALTAPANPAPVAEPDALVPTAAPNPAFASVVQDNTGGGDEGGVPVLQDSNIRDQAFANVARGALPMTPQQVHALHYLFDQNQQATVQAPGLPPKPTSSSVIVNLSPGAVPPVIRLAAGFITSLVFLDTTGAPWPIKAYDLGDPRGFNIQWDKQSNMLLVQALSAYKSANLAVMLKDLDTPVMITLLPGQQAVDYRVDLRLPGVGPNAAPSVNGMPDSADPKLLSVLDGVPPDGSEEVMVQGGEAQAWVVGATLYLRTRLTVLSPGWISMMTSADGMHAYQLNKTPLLLVSQRGKMTQLNIKGL